MTETAGWGKGGVGGGEEAPHGVPHAVDLWRPREALEEGGRQAPAAEDGAGGGEAQLAGENITKMRFLENCCNK